MSKSIEYRIFKSEVRATKPTNDAPEITGYAAVFNTQTDLGWMREQIAPGAFKRAIAEGQDVRCLFNHEPDHVLGRTKNGTLTLKEDNTGLHITCAIPDTQTGRDVHALISRGDVDQMSFGFIVRDEKVTYDDDGEATRTILDCDMFDVSPVTFPAYPTTSVEACSNARVLRRYKRDAEDGDAANDHDTPPAKGDVSVENEEFHEAMGIHHLDESSMHAEHAAALRALAPAMGDTPYATHCMRAADMHDEQSDRAYDMSAMHFDRAADCREARGTRADSKKKTKRVAGEDLTSDCFLYVGDPQKTATWALPWKFSSEEKTKSHLRNALARFNQTSTIPADEKAAVKKKLVAKAKEHGINVAGEGESKSISLEQMKAKTRLAQIALI